MKEEEKEEKEKDPWWTPKLSRGIKFYVFLMFMMNITVRQCQFSEFAKVKIYYLYLSHTGFGDHINWVSYEKGLKEAKDRFVTTELIRQ